jgi:hypothetical protein
LGPRLVKLRSSRRYLTLMWRWLARISVGLSMGIFGLLLFAGILLVVIGAVVFYLFISG